VFEWLVVHILFTATQGMRIRVDIDNIRPPLESKRNAPWRRALTITSIEDKGDAEKSRQIQSVVVSLKVDRNMIEAKNALCVLRGNDLSELCRMFELPVGGSRDERISRLLKMGEKGYTRLVRVARQVSFGYCAEDYVSAREMRVIVLGLRLSASGNKHEMFMNAVINDKSPIPNMLATMDIKGVRKTYKRLLGRPPIDSESVLKEEISRWLNFEPYREPVEAARPKTYPGPFLPPMVRQTEEPLSEPSNQRSVTPSDDSQPVPTAYDVAISYAGEDETIAKEIAEAMKGVGLRVFFAPFEQANLWGKKLSDAFREAFGAKAIFVLVLVSKHYPRKDFTNFEFTIARDEARKRKEEFILPVRLDNTQIIGLHPDIHYVDYEKHQAKGVAKLMAQKMSDKTQGVHESKPWKFDWRALTKSGRQ